MGGFLSIKQVFGKALPAKVVENKTFRSGKDFNHASSVALIIKDVDEAYLKEKKKFLDHIKGEYGIRDGFILVYTENSEKDLPVYLNHLKELDYFGHDDLNWRLKPAGMIDVFCKKKYDILIDLCSEECRPLEHIVASSNARMKIGRKGAPHEKYFGFVLDIPKNLSEKDFLKHTEYYLSKLSFN